MTPVLQELIVAVAKIVGIFGVLLGLFALMTWVERRTLAFMQFRLGPNRTGPMGLFQPVADGIKLFFKEEIIPAGTSRFAFLAAPAVAIVTAVTAIAVIPYGPPFTVPAWGFLPEWLQGWHVTLQIADLDAGVLFTYACGSLGIYGIVLAGWASNNKYSLVGGLRSAAQLFSYELSLGLSWAGIFMTAQSFRLETIVGLQAGGLASWNLFLHPVAFLVYLVAATAEANRTPFDLPEAEQELVAGFNTEYGSMKFALIQMSEYLNMITVSVLCANMFLGGWHSPIQGVFDGHFLFGMMWLVVKVGSVLFFFIWLRGTFPRLRYDQLMSFGWKVLLPVATINVMVTAALVVKGIL